MEGFKFSKSLEKFLRGGGVAFVATAIALFFGKDTATIQALIEDVGTKLLVAIPVMSGLLDAVVNAIKYFNKNKGR